MRGCSDGGRVASQCCRADNCSTGRSSSRRSAASTAPRARMVDQGNDSRMRSALSNGTFARSGFSIAMPIEDGPAILAVRPEALDLEAAEPGQARVHRVTDYGTHGLVDLGLPDGTRLKAMVSHPDMFQAGQGVVLKPRAVTAYRDKRQVYRS